MPVKNGYLFKCFLWIGLIAISLNAASSLSKWTWTYVEIASGRPYNQATGNPPYGIAVADLNKDGYLDIVNGNYFYRNPGAAGGAWHVSTLGHEEAIAFFDIDGDNIPDVFSVGPDGAYWYKANDNQGNSWTAYSAGGNHGATAHNNGPQGYAVAQIVAGSKPQIIVPLRTNDVPSGVGYFTVPSNPAAGNAWPFTQITNQGTMGLSVGDINNDGTIDVCGGSADGSVWWLENPGTAAGTWTLHIIGNGGSNIKTARVGDINGDGKLDIITCQENSPSVQYWFERPADPRSANWVKHTICTTEMCLAMQVGDIDGDGAPEVYTGEALGSMKQQIWDSPDHGQTWQSYLVNDNTKANVQPHTGTLLVDLNNDGTLDIITDSWYNPDKFWYFRSNCPDCATSVLGRPKVDYNLLTGNGRENYGATVFDLRGMIVGKLSGVSVLPRNLPDGVYLYKLYGSDAIAVKTIMLPGANNRGR
ncbi:MAG: VCBS repeat-containing protein [Chitinivibrionales bacterium]|nr:VCBS repeat-containing protein [Chitinivibrionales bacterium]